MKNLFLDFQDYLQYISFEICKLHQYFGNIHYYRNFLLSNFLRNLTEFLNLYRKSRYQI